jgi:AraC family transcriptional regulator
VSVEYVASSAGERFGTLVSARAVGEFMLRESRYERDLAFPAHRHGEPYFAYVARGVMHESRGSDVRGYGAGSVHFHPAQDAHAGSSGPDGLTCLSIVPLGRHAQRVGDRPAEAPPEHSEIARLAARCHREFRIRDAASDLALEGVALELLAALLRQTTVRERKAPCWLLDVRDHLHAHHAERVTLAKLAAVGGVHPVHLVRAFRTHLGATPGAYVRMLRLEEAARKLAQGDEAIVDIALDAGFASQAHFTRAFGRAFGETPAAYRRSRKATTLKPR